MKKDNPFHHGEIEAQRRASESALAERNSAVMSGSIIGGALPFLKQQTMAVVGTASPDGALWASPLFGARGFVSPDDARTVRFTRNLMRTVANDSFWENIRSGADVGMLAIELATRRRLRVNGTITEVGEDGFVLAVREAYPNCPKYIQRRTPIWTDDLPSSTEAVTGNGARFTSEAVLLLESADTLFLTSSHPQRGFDVSHRGGSPGFIRTLTATTFRVPDYAGNSLFNTFGNLLVDPRAGVTVMDFAHGRALQMTGQVELEWNQPDEQGTTGGTGRFWTFALDRWCMLALPTGLGWEFVDASPYNPGVV